MPDQNAPLPVAGWYPDPEHETQDRWWDGSNWSDTRRPREAAPVAPAAPASPYVPAGTAEPYGSNVAPYGPTAGQPAAAQPYGAQPYGAQPYGTPAYGAYNYGYAPPQNVPALVGFILALSGFVLGYFTYGFLGLAGAIVSIVGLSKANKMRAAGQPTHRYGMALTGVIIGFASVLLTWGLLVLVFAVWLPFSL